MKEFKTGDRVKVKNPMTQADVGSCFGWPLDDDVKRWAGQTLTLAKPRSSKAFYVEENGFYWYTSLFEPLDDYDDGYVVGDVTGMFASLLS